VFTVGHSTHSIEKLIELLTLNSVTAVADVRSSPYSRMNPQFNRDGLEAALQESGVSYVFLGRELGARPEDRSCYAEGKARYDLIAQSALFQEGLDRVALGLATNRVALLCAEKDPLICHRAILVCRQLAVRGIDAHHILETGQIETHEQALTRLLTELKLPDRDLFRDHEEIVEDAYRRRGERIAYSEHLPLPTESESGD